MKKLIIPALTCLFLVGLSSCNKCQTCTLDVLGVSNSQEICEKNFDSKQDYEDWISAYESAGGDCN